jgi:hypothetical protein
MDTPTKPGGGPDASEESTTGIEVLVYVGQSSHRAGDREPEDEQVLFRRGKTDEQGLAKVALSSEELDRLSTQAQQIATGIQTSAQNQHGLVVDSITLHVGLSASGRFFFVGAGAEAALDITWRNPSALITA